MKEENIVTNIFKDIEKAIEETKSDFPVQIKDSKFLKKLKEIKKKYETRRI